MHEYAWNQKARQQNGDSGKARLFSGRTGDGAYILHDAWDLKIKEVYKMEQIPKVEGEQNEDRRQDI